MISLIISFVGLLIGTKTDIDRREVPDWLNYSLFSLGILLSALYSIIMHDIVYLIASILIGVLAFGLGSLMYYTGQWGGGDTKMLAALGALLATTAPLYGKLLPFDAGWVTHYNILFVPVLFFQILIAGAIYGIIFSIIMVFKNPKKWIEQAKSLLSQKSYRITRILVFVFAFLLLAFGFMQQDSSITTVSSLLAILIVFTFYLSVGAKAVELACMYRYMTTDTITEGEWIAHDVLVKGKRICGPSDLGITNAQIKTLKRLGIKKVLVKVGIPFLPAFLAGFIATVLYGNLLLFLF